MEEYLEALTRVRPEVLNEETKKLYDVIMQVIDERDKYKTMYEMEKKLFVDADMKIDRAIEYTNKHIKDDWYCRKSDYLINNLLEILKGEPNNE